MAADDMSFVAGFLAASGLFWTGGGALWLAVCARRLSRLRLRLVGVPARGEVIGMVVSCDASGAIRNAPRVRYFAPTGPPVVTRAYGYRPHQSVATGAQVRLWYDPLRPERILVSRFDLKLRDWLELVGALVVLGIGVMMEFMALTMG
ncbi:DUF3592 domain-containing protein [Catenulispora pinisilvae]|uniref:DUF3592 domain-containing protein n=1 Tax=Catenulispora pinisilvae TaxID=2705253 RepID=UPI00189140E4|nr:DUF3592 domain-containing protein [Catenulispora pinisilvae]